MNATRLITLGALVFAVQLTYSSPASAQEQDTRESSAPASAPGTITRDCPFNCGDAGIPKEHCKDWRDGDTCYVQDTSPRGRLSDLTEEEEMRMEQGAELGEERQLNPSREKDDLRRQERTGERTTK